MKEIVLEIEYGGLGDNLFYSALPRLIKNNKIADHVYISNKSKFRNSDIKKLIWVNNPFIDGFSESCATHPKGHKKSSINKITNMIAAMYGIIVNYEIEPYISDDFEVIKEYSNCTFLDLNYSSYVGAITILDKLLIAYRHSGAILINPNFILNLLTPNKKIKTTSLYHYAQIIKSCKSFICLASGGATLAAALNKKSCVYYGYGQSSIFHHASNQYIMIGAKNFYRKLIALMFGYRNYIIREIFNIK